MKKTIIILGIIFSLAFDMKGQPISTDTVVCIIDTTKCYVKYSINPFASRYPKIHWKVSIEGHYYDVIKPLSKNFACIVFIADDLRNIHGTGFKGPFSIKVPKEMIIKHFVLANEEWINQQTDLQVLGRKIGRYPSYKYNFLVFKQDFENSKNDSVTMHRVQIGYFESQE